MLTKFEQEVRAALLLINGEADAGGPPPLGEPKCARCGEPFDPRNSRNILCGPCGITRKREHNARTKRLARRRAAQ